MTAYIIVEVEINNHEDHEEYKKLTSHSVVLSGGSFIVRGGGSEVLASLRSTRRFVTSMFIFRQSMFRSRISILRLKKLLLEYFAEL